MARALVIHCHPDPASFTAAVRDRVCGQLAGLGAEIRLRDLYAEGFDPVLSRAEWVDYTGPDNRDAVDGHVADLLWCDTLIFIYPTWWYGLPAMLKGWLDCVMLPDVAFLMPESDGQIIRPGLTHVRRIGVFTTCGASWWLTQLVGAPGKRTLLRGIALLCGSRRRRVIAAHYLMDSSTPESRARHLDRVERKIERLLRR